MNLGTTLATSFLVTLVRPSTWVLGLATFLLRGGLLLVLAPIVVIPSAVGLANVVAPGITELVFAGFSPTLVTLAAVSLIGVAVWLVGGGLLAAAAEAEAIRIVADDEDVVEASGSRPPAVHGTPAGGALRILAVRLIAHLPTVLALAWGATRVVTIAYRELTVPSDTVTPVAIRVVRGAPDALAILLLAWLVGEILGALAARRVVLADAGVSRALGDAVYAAVRQPVRTIVLAVIPLAALVAVFVPSAAAAAIAWSAIRAALTTGPGVLVSTVALVLFLVLWLGGLALLAVVSAWRTAAWTVHAAGTFGAGGRTRPGDWLEGAESGTLADLRPRGVDQDSR